MKSLSKYSTKSIYVANEALEAKNPITWCSLVDILKGRAKREMFKNYSTWEENELPSIVFWMEVLIDKRIKRFKANILEDDFIFFHNKYFDNDVTTFSDKILTFTEIKELFNNGSMRSVDVVIRLLSDFYNKKETDFDLQLEVIQDIMLYNKVFDR